jgi:sugar/nucleoside kinase (ribokinase family)
MNSDVDVLMIGHFAKDRIIVGDQDTIASGGAVYYGSIALRHLGLSVGVVTRLHPDDFPLLDELRAAGVQVYATAASETSGIANNYNPADLDRRTTKPLGFAGPILATDIPDIRARLYAVASIMAGEVDLTTLKALAGQGPVSLDVQGFVRVREGENLVTRPWPEMAEGLAHVTYLKVDLAEAEFLTGLSDLSAAARQLAQYGPKEIVLTQSSGVTVYASSHIYQAPFQPRSLDGRTGRGDTCFMTYLGKRLTKSPAEATRWAGAVTTLKLEKPGPWDGDIEAVRRLLQIKGQEVR